MHTLSYDVLPAAELGVDEQRLQELRDRVARGVDQGPLPSVQLAVARRGRLVLFDTFGSATNTTRYNIYSCTKPLVAAGIWQLMGEGRIDIARPVSQYLPPFAGNDKETVTVEQVLCHTSGFPNAPMGPPDWWTREGRLEQIQNWHLEWEPGSRMVYHPTSAHWVLAELIEAVTGLDYREQLQRSIIQPLGLHGPRLGLPAGQQQDIAPLVNVGASPTAEELKAAFGRAVDWPDTTDDSMLVFNQPEVRALGVPGGGGIATAADVALFYQALLHNPKQLWHPAILEDALSRVRVSFPDPMTGVPGNRGLGVVISGDDAGKPYRGMGHTVSGRAFGHQGVGGQVAWGDPASGLSFCLLTNGLDSNPLRSARFCAAANNRAGALCADLIPG